MKEFFFHTFLAILVEGEYLGIKIQIEEFFKKYNFVILLTLIFYNNAITCITYNHIS